MGQGKHLREARYRPLRIGAIGRTCRLAAVLVLMTFASCPALAQQPGIPLEGQPVAGVAVPCAECPEFCPMNEDCVGHHPGWEFYVKTGPVFPIGSGFLDDRIETGWTVQIGAQEAFWAPLPSLVIFREFGAAYTANDGDERRVTSLGFFQGRFPDDDHVHFLRDGVLVAAPLGATDVNGPLIRTRLEELHRAGIHLALGGSYAPAWLNPLEGRQIRLDFRTGIRSGGINADFEEQVPRLLIEGIQAHFGHGHRQVELSTRGSEDPELFFAIFGSIGVGLTCHDVELAGRSLGAVTFGAEVEWTKEWFDLGDFGRGDDDLATVAPRLVLSFTF